MILEILQEIILKKYLKKLEILKISKYCQYIYVFFNYNNNNNYIVINNNNNNNNNNNK